MARLQIRMWLLPALQAILTALSTGMGVLLVLLWRPNRKRYIPFYSDASHNDPERIILACGENLACMLMPIVAICEYLHQTRLLQSLSAVHFNYTPSYRCIKISPKRIIDANLFFTLCTTIFFFITTNVPSKYPATKVHQFAASSLIFFYAIQATLKAILAITFNNYKRSPQLESDKDDEIEKVCKAENGCFKRALIRLDEWWDRHHLKVRIGIAIMLWIALVGTWLCFMGRLLAREWKISGHVVIRGKLSTLMAVLVHMATVSCIILMCIMAVDMRFERIVLNTYQLERSIL